MRKPPKGARCDMSTGWHTGSAGEPIVDMCKNPATKVIPAGQGSFFEIYVCDDCAKARELRDV